MIFTIPEWPSDSNLKHVATSWKLTKDAAGTDIVDSVDESSDDLLSWKSDTIIPNGKVWFIWALRKLEDENGSTVNNESWIGPKPVFSENTNVNDYLAPELFITDPKIKDVSYLPGEEVTIEIAKPNSNIGYKGTLVALYDDNDNLVFKKVFNYDDEEGKFSIKAEEVDFANIFKLGIEIVNIGEHSTISRVIRDAYYLKKVYYRIEGHRFNLDPIENNIIKIVSTSQVKVKIKSAKLLALDNTELLDIDVDGNTIKVPITLELDRAYKIKFNLEYTDDNNKTVDLSDVILISTMGELEENIKIDKHFKYDYKITKISVVSESVINISDDLSNTEEFYTYITPIKMKDNGIDLTVLDKQNDRLATFKETDISLDGDYAIRLVNKTEGYIQTKNDDGKLVLTKFTYDPYRSSVKLGNNLTLDIAIDTPVGRKVMEMGDGLYIVGVNSSDNTKISIYKFNIENMTTNLVREYTYATNLTDVALVEYSETEIHIMPKGPNAYLTLLYSTEYNYVTDDLTIPDDFRNKNLISFKLRNDNMVTFKLKTTENELNFFLYDKEQNAINEHKVNYDGSGLLEHFITTKVGYIYLLLKDRVNKTKEFFKFH